MQNYGKEWRMIDYYEQSGEGLAHYAKMLKGQIEGGEHRKDYLYGIHTAPFDIEVTEFGTGKTRKETAETLGISFEIAPKLSIEDGINQVRMRFNQMWFDETKCEQFLDLLPLYHKEWDEKRGCFKNKPHHDFTSNAADALRYWAVTPDQGEETTSQFTPEWVTGK